MAEDSPLLEIDHLAISFAHPRPAVNDVSVRLHDDEIVALVGESGSGKSMTARTIIGLLPPGARATGSVRLRGRELLGLSERELDQVRGRRVAMVFQEPQTALNPVRTIGWQLGEALRAHGRDGRRAPRVELRTRAIELLRRVEIPDPEVAFSKYPHQLSGGQKQRVVLALALAAEPDLLLADEPTTALDVTVQAEILRLLRRVREESGTAILLITHNMGVVAELADRVIVLRRGDIVEEAKTEELFARPQELYTRQLLGSVLRLPSTSAAPADAPDAPAAADPALVLDDVSVRFGSRRRGRGFVAVDGVSLKVDAGEVLGLVGESGSGKTTLGRVAAGLVTPESGRVAVAGRAWDDGSAAERRRLRRRLAFVHQDPQASLDPRMTVEQSVREPLDVHRIGSQSDRETKVAEMLDAVQLPAEYAERLPDQLSGGQRQRVALARALVLEPSLVIADEPTSALDVSVQARVLDLFGELQARLGFACLFISHDLAVVHRVADRVAVLRQGKLVEEGPVGNVFLHPQHDYTRQLLAAVPSPEPGAKRVATKAG